MGKLNEAYEDIAHTGANIKEKLTSVIRENFAFIILFFNIAISVAFALFTPSVENPFNAAFFINLARNITTSMFSFCCFVSWGQKREKLSMPGYNENTTQWSSLSDRVRTSMSTLFEQYCKTRLEAEREERRRAIITNNTMIDYAVYESEYKGKAPAVIMQYARDGLISYEDARFIKRANKRIRVKPINPLIILCGVKISSLNDAGRDGISPSTLSVLSRPVSLFIFNAAISMIHGEWSGLSTGSEIFVMISSVFTIILSSVAGYSSGVNAARKEHGKIKSRIFFIENFLKTQNEITNE